MTNRKDYTGVNTVTKRRVLSDGRIEIVAYYYHRVSGTLLGKSSEGVTKNDAIEVVRCWEAESGVSGPLVGTVNHLFSKFRASKHFATLAEKTRYEYRLEMTRLESLIGHHMVDSLKRSILLKIRDERQDTPFAANATIRTFNAILSWGKSECSEFGEKAAPKVGFLPTQPRDAIWSPHHRDAFMNAAPPELRRVFAVLLYTVQRGQDALRLRKDQILERAGRQWINLRQCKTTAIVAIPVHGSLATVLAENPVDGAYLCSSPTGTFWAYSHFSKLWDRTVRIANFQIARQMMRESPLPPASRVKDRDIAKNEIRSRLIVGLQRRDLRRTGMVELALCGVPDTQIASLSGHSIDTTRRILDTYIPRREELALAAVETWEATEEKVVALHLRAPQRSMAEVMEQWQNRTANRTANRRSTANRKRSGTI